MTGLLFPALPSTPTPPRSNAAARERRVSPRRGLDWFRTPAWATEALLAREKFPGAVWECAAGDGAMVDPIAAAGHRVVATDIHPRRPDVLAADFLATAALPAGVESIITNSAFHHRRGLRPACLVPRRPQGGGHSAPGVLGGSDAASRDLRPAPARAGVGACQPRHDVGGRCRPAGR